MAYVAIAAARVALGLETARHGYGKLNHWPEFATMIRFEGPWGPPVLPQLNTLPTAATEAVAITSTVVQLGGGGGTARLSFSVTGRLACALCSADAIPPRSCSS